MDEANNNMISDLKNSSIEKISESYPLISSLKQFLENPNINIQDFKNWLTFTQNLLSQNSISFKNFLLKIPFIKENDNFSTELFKKINLLSIEIPSLKDLIKENVLGPICFVTPELGRWSTVGGLGVMVDELSQGLNSAGQKVLMISPYYDRNRKGESEYLKNDPFNIKYLRNIEVNLDKKYNFGIHMGEGNNGIQYYFIHNYEIFPRPYPEGRVDDNIRRVCLFCKASLQLLCDIKLIPAVIVTNDWYTGLVAAYGKSCFGGIFSGTTFMHICHNLEPEYEGRFYPTREQGTLDYIHQINRDLLVDPYWKQIVINPSRCALIMSDQWGTVSHSYKEDLLRTSPLAGILREKPRPFSYPNGVFKEVRLKMLTDKAGSDHDEAKEYIQKKYFGYQQINKEVPIYAFVGRITRQKGVHLILEVAEELINKTNGQINILIGGMGVHSDPYFRDCENRIRHLRSRFPYSFWANPNEFFVDGPRINIGADFGLMPSLFEPGGIVQHEFFLGKTPVIAFRTGGLKDTVFEFLWDNNTGNGLTFDNYCRNGLLDAMWRSINLFKNKEKYNICRENAFNSVIDVKDVSKAWGREFYRLKGKVFFNVRDVLGNEDDDKKEKEGENENDDNRNNVSNGEKGINRNNYIIKGGSQNLNPFGGFVQKKINSRSNLFNGNNEVINTFNRRVNSYNNLNNENVNRQNFQMNNNFNKKENIISQRNPINNMNNNNMKNNNMNNNNMNMNQINNNFNFNQFRSNYNINYMNKSRNNDIINNLNNTSPNINFYQRKDSKNNLNNLQDNNKNKQIQNNQNLNNSKIFEQNKNIIKTSNSININKNIPHQNSPINNNILNNSFNQKINIPKTIENPQLKTQINSNNNINFIKNRIAIPNIIEIPQKQNIKNPINEKIINTSKNVKNENIINTNKNVKNENIINTNKNVKNENIINTNKIQKDNIMNTNKLQNENIMNTNKLQNENIMNTNKLQNENIINTNKLINSNSMQNINKYHKKSSKNNIGFKPHNDIYYYSQNIKNDNFIPSGNINTINQNNNINNFNQNNNINNLIVINNGNTNFNKKDTLNNLILLANNGLLNNNRITNNNKNNFTQNTFFQNSFNQNDNINSINNNIPINNSAKIIEENNNKKIKEEFANNQITKNKVHRGFIPAKKNSSNFNLNNLNNNNFNMNNFNSNNNNNTLNNEKRTKLFIFKGEDLPKNTESVQVCGSYDKWNVRHPLTYDKKENLWFVNLTLNRGKIFYKYIVNGEWIINPREKVDNDGNNENNVYVL